jgi:hypothetical protein
MNIARLLDVVQLVVVAVVLLLLPLLHLVVVAIVTLGQWDPHLCSYIVQ